VSDPTRATPTRADATLVSVLSGMAITAMFIGAAVSPVGTLLPWRISL
jgi:hypothetical protein